MLISASEDNSLRMWNVENSKCVAVFAGEIHRDQVLTVDINHTGDFASVAKGKLITYSSKVQYLNLKKLKENL